MRDNSLTSSIVKSADKAPEAGDLSPDLGEVTKTPGVEWSPLQLSSHHLQPPLIKPSLRTETLERHQRRPSLRTFTSGRCSAEPLESHKLSQGLRARDEVRGLASGAHSSLVSALPSSLSELDLRWIKHGD